MAKAFHVQFILYKVRHHFGFTIDSRPGDDQLHHPIWDRVNNCWMRVPRYENDLHCGAWKSAHLLAYLFLINEFILQIDTMTFLKYYHQYFTDPSCAFRQTHVQQGI